MHIYRSKCNRHHSYICPGVRLRSVAFGSRVLFHPPPHRRGVLRPAGLPPSGRSTLIGWVRAVNSAPHPALWFGVLLLYRPIDEINTTRELITINKKQNTACHKMTLCFITYVNFIITFPKQKQNSFIKLQFYSSS